MGKIPTPKPLDPIELRLIASRLATRATQLLREAHAIVAAHDPIPGICVDCAVPFEISAEEAARYFAKQWDLPKRCEPCMAVKRERRQKELAERREWEARRARLTVVEPLPPAPGVEEPDEWQQVS